MKLISFSLKNYRSISTAYKLPLSDYAVIVGPNNEGKSNILKGLGLALSILTNERFFSIGGHINHFVGRYSRGAVLSNNRLADYLRYNWERDFPINLQKTSKKGRDRSEFTCEFELEEKEFREFKEKTKINLATNLKASVIIEKSGKVTVDFLLNGKGKVALNTKKREISNFINSKLLLQYIPAIRTSDLAIEIVDNLLEEELSTLEGNPEFQNVIKIIEKLQKPIIKKISKSLTQSVSKFIPDVASVSIKNQEDISELISASCRIYINDGIETDLKLKGDGVISLTAISLLQHFSKHDSLNKGFVLLLEEPESHLHPKAIHNLKEILHEISKTNQVIMTTHSPIIVDRLEVHHNIIVQNGKAGPAENVSEIRKSLGITMSDNLSSAYLVLLVEGLEDVIILWQWLKEKSVKIKSALENATLIIDHLGGASNICYKATQYKSNLCNVVAYLDDDESGKKAINDARSKNILKDSEYVLSSCLGRQTSEIEDLILISAYKQVIIEDYGVNLEVPHFKDNKTKWSDRVKKLFKSNGKLWNDKIEVEIKQKISKQAASLGLSSLDSHKISSIDSLVLTIESVLNKQDS